MEKENVVFDQKKIDDLERTFIDGKIKPLDDIFTIEDVSMKIKEINEKIDFLKEYKSKKANSIAISIKSLENRIDFYRQVISKTLTLNKQNSVSFPGSCQVSKATNKGKWVVIDETALAELLKKEEKFNEVFETITTTVLDKKELTKLLNNWKKSGKLDKIDFSSFLGKEDDKVSVRIKYDKPEEEETSIEDIEEEVPVKNVKNAEDNDYDAL